MIGFLKRRKLRKQLKEYLHMARHARNMREDIADPKDLETLAEAEAVVSDIRNGGKGNVEKAVATLEAAANRVHPFARRTFAMEWTETIIVALGAAMAIRAFFFQPFKIPTGSMQPTLNGIITEYQESAGFTDHQPFKFAKWLLTGTSYKEVRAKASGQLMPIMLPDGRQAWLAPAPGDKVAINIGGTEQRFPSYMAEWFVRKQSYDKGEVIARAKAIAGDHIIVNKMKYNFMAPERGDISVFDTAGLEGVRQDTFYIKRMIGLPGEKVQIKDGEIVIDGNVVREPPMFEKIATDPMYKGHTNEGLLETPDSFIQLSDDEYLMMGDNTENSFDGRFFGGVKRNKFQGPAIFVYWPFREHWGIVR